VKALRDRLGIGRSGPQPDRDSGMTLIEVVVAMMIFTIISTGVLYTMMSLLTVTRDSRARQVATNLAAQEIDLARDAKDIFKLGDRPSTVVLNGDTFHVLRTSDWVTNEASTEACGTGTTSGTSTTPTLRYKRVHVKVTWDGMKSPNSPVVSDTLINPNDRINDPELGTILVSVRTASGVGIANATITAKFSNNSGATLTTTTDAKGCGFLLKVAPGAYNVTLTNPAGQNYVDEKGVASPVKIATVAAGTSASVPFTYDKAGTLKVTYSASGAVLANDMPTSLLSTRDTALYASTTAANPRTLSVHPWPDGYVVTAGNSAQCAAADPGLWTESSTKAGGIRPDIVFSNSGVTTNVTISLQKVKVKNLSGTVFIVARSVSNASSGQPACATEQIYRFASTNSGNITIALPYGTWEIHKSSTSGFTPTAATRIAASSFEDAPADAVSSSNNTVTFDPRGAL